MALIVNLKEQFVPAMKRNPSSEVRDRGFQCGCLPVRTVVCLVAAVRVGAVLSSGLPSTFLCEVLKAARVYILKYNTSCWYWNIHNLCILYIETYTTGVPSTLKHIQPVYSVHWNMYNWCTLYIETYATGVLCSLKRVQLVYCLHWNIHNRYTLFMETYTTGVLCALKPIQLVYSVHSVLSVVFIKSSPFEPFLLLCD